MLPRRSPEAWRIKDHQAGGKICTGSSPSRHRQSQSTGSRAGGWAGREDPKPHPCHPHPCPCCQSWGCCCLHGWKRGKKRKKERGRQRGSTLEVPAASPVSPACQSHLALCWGLPGDATDSSSWCWAANPLSAPRRPLHTCTDVAHTCTDVGHTCRQRPTGMQPPPTHPAVPAALLEQKGDGSDPQRGAQREALTLIFLQTRSCSASLSKLHYSPATNPLRATSNTGLRKRKPQHILGRSPRVPQPAQHPKPIAP